MALSLIFCSKAATSNTERSIKEYDVKEQRDIVNIQSQYHLLRRGRKKNSELTKPVPVQTHRGSNRKKTKEEEEARLRGQLSILDDYYEDEDEERRAKLEFLNTKIFGRPMFHGTPVLRIYSKKLALEL